MIFSDVIPVVVQLLNRLRNLENDLQRIEAARTGKLARATMSINVDGNYVCNSHDIAGESEDWHLLLATATSITKRRMVEIEQALAKQGVSVNAFGPKVTP